MSEELQGRVDDIRARVEAACRRAARDPDTVSIVAVSKTFGPDDVGAVAECGLAIFGESKVQEAAHKIPLCSGRLEWHMVGHLQGNKVRLAVGLFKMIHSVDSLNLLVAINAAAEQAGVTMPVLLEVNVSGERSKFGMPPEAVAGVLAASSRLINVSVTGLMTIPPFTPEPEDARPFFRRLRERRDEWRQASGVELNELSMGMSHDFEVAIEEGSTLVRIGAAIFGERKPKARITAQESEFRSQESE